MLTQEPPDLDPFLGCDGVERLRQNYSKPAERYLGGDGTVGTSEVKDISLKDGIFRTYEHLLSLLPLVSGEPHRQPLEIFLICKNLYVTT